jgi:hypothetical protein
MVDGGMPGLAHWKLLWLQAGACNLEDWCSLADVLTSSLCLSECKPMLWADRSQRQCTTVVGGHGIGCVVCRAA